MNKTIFKTKKIMICTKVLKLKNIFKAKGVSIENFKKNQEEIFGRYDSGFFGYRGLQGNIYNSLKESKTTFKMCHCSIKAKRMIP